MSHFPRPLRRVLGTAALLALPACATLDRDECLNADWRTIGYEDGVAGHPAKRIGRHRRACAQYGVKPDLAAYTAGREAGLRVYCRPANGYRVGLKGGIYRNVCPPDLAGPFEEAYAYGRRLYRLDSEISRMNSRRIGLYDALAEVREDIAAHEAELVAHGVTPARRARLLEELKALTARAADMEHELAALDQDIAAAREERRALAAGARW